MRVVSTAGTLAALIGFTLPNEAQTPAKRFQFGLDGTLIAAESGTLTLEGNEFDYTSTQGGIASGLGMTLGIGLTDSLVLNTRLVQSSGTTRLESDASSNETRTATFSLVPRLEVLFGSSAARFFLFGTAGYRSSVSQTTLQTQDPQSGAFIDDGSRLKTTGIIYGAGLGLHGFVGDRVSIDPAISLLRVSGESESGALDGKTSSTAIVLTLGISAWLGGASSQQQDSSLEPAAEEVPVSDAPSVGSDRPSFSTEVSSTGVVSRQTQLANNSRLLLSGHPAEDGARVQMKLSLLGMAPAELGSWSACTEARLVAANQVFPLERVSVAESGANDSPSLQATARVGALIELVRTERAVIEICSAKTFVGARVRRDLLDFLRTYKRLAEKQGTWDPSLSAEPSEPAPTEAPPAEQEEQEAPETPADASSSVDAPTPDAPVDN